MNNQSEKRDLIITAAENLFHRYGYSKTSIDDIARDSGLGKGTIYYYFESKEDIFQEVVKINSESFFKILNDMIKAQTDFSEKFRLAISMPVKIAYEHAPLMIDALKNFPPKYLIRFDEIRNENKLKMISIVESVLQTGAEQNAITCSLPFKKVAKIIIDWFLLGDENIVIKNPAKFIKKAEEDYKIITEIILNGILKREEN